MTEHHSHACPGHLDAEAAPGPADRPFSPLGWSVWQRLGVAGLACLALWAVVLWALD